MGAEQFYALAAELQAAPAKMLPPLTAVFEVVGQETEDLWRANAEGTSGAHGVHYPASIEHTMKPGGGGIAVDVNPNAGMPQGGMSFEFGSVKQPPHLDGLKAFMAMQGRVVPLVVAAVTPVIP